jgi:hypothetical protein
MPTYLDDNGNPISSNAPVYIDPRTGERIGAAQHGGAAIDLSAGLVPKQSSGDVDISAGLTPRIDPKTGERLRGTQIDYDALAAQHGGSPQVDYDALAAQHGGTAAGSIATIPMLSPDGTSGDVPSDRVPDALKAGFKQAVPMTSPDGKTGYIPAERARDAIKAGFKPDYSSLTANPNGEGVYQMKSRYGQTIGVPYSRVSAAMGQGNAFASQQESARFNKDNAYDLSQRDPYLQGLTPSVGGIAQGALDEAGNMVKGAASVFKAPQNVGEAALGPVLPAYRMAKGYVQSAGQGIGQAVDYARNGQPLRSAATALGAVNPLSSATTASINGAVDHGDNIGSVIGHGALDAGMLASPEAANAIAKSGLPSAFLGRTANTLYGSALKPSTTLSAAERSNLVNTGLEYGIPISNGGMTRLGQLIDDLNQKIAAEIAKDPNRPIDPNAVAARSGQVAGKFSNQVVAQPDLDTIEAMKQQFLKERGATPGTPAVPPQPTGLLDANGRPIMSAGTPATPAQPAPPMSAAAAQTMKQGTYNVLKGKYGEQGSAAVEEQKGLARGLKEELATQFPEINNMNASESRLLDLEPVLERAVNRISNNHTIGIGGPILGTAVKAGTGSTGLAAAAAVLKSVVDIPLVKSRLAIALSKGAKIPFPQAAARVQAYSASLGSYAAATGDPAFGSSSTAP